MISPDMPQVRDNAIQAISDLPAGIWAVTIEKHVVSKSREQRGWFHLLCQILGDQIGMHPGDIKEIAKAKLMGWKQVSFGGVTLTMADGHSEKLKMDQYSRLIEIVYELAGEAGMALPEAFRDQGQD